MIVSLSKILVMFKVNVSLIMVKNFNEINMIELFKEKCNSIFRDWFVLG